MSAEFAIASSPSPDASTQSTYDSLSPRTPLDDTLQLVDQLTTTMTRTALDGVDDTSPALHPSIRAAVDAATRQRAKNTDFGSGNRRVTKKFASTQELKLAAKKRKTRSGGVEDEKSTTALVPINNTASLSALHNTSSSVSSASSPTPLYTHFQTLCTEAQSQFTSSSSSFPASLTTSFERTSYWERAIVKRSERPGTLVWIYEEYAVGSGDDDQSTNSSSSSTATLDLLYSTPSLYSLSWSSLISFFTDWSLIPSITTKQRLAILYQKFGVEVTADGQARDVGISYEGFLRTLAAVACEANIPAATGNSSTSITSCSSTSSSSLTPSQLVLHFLRYTHLSDLEYVSSRLQQYSERNKFRKRMEAEKRKSVYVHRPRCLSLGGGGGKSGVVAVCDCATRPVWDEEQEKMIVKGIQEKSFTSPSSSQGESSDTIQAAANTKTKILHIDPHKHDHSRRIKQNTHKSKAGTESASSRCDEEEKSSTSTSSSTVHPFTSNELLAFNTLRKYECLPLEDMWCNYVGPWIDMGVIQVDKAVNDDSEVAAESSSSSTTTTFSHRQHLYTLTLHNLHRDSILLRANTDEVPWLELSYTQKQETPYLALGMMRKMEIRAPLVMPLGVEKEGARRKEGVELVGRIRIETENQRTKELAQAFLPVYAKLMLKE